MRIATKHLCETARDLLVLRDSLHHVDRDADGTRLVGERASNRLADPPGCIRRELKSFLPVEFVDGAEEAEIPFLNEVEERKVRRAADILLCNRNDKAQVAPREDVARLCIALLDALRELALLGGGQERVLPDLAEIDLDGVIAGRVAIFDIARREVFVSRIFKHAALEHVDARSRETLIQRFEETDILFDMRK